jgi:hypothetical protein
MVIRATELETAKEILAEVFGLLSERKTVVVIGKALYYLCKICTVGDSVFAQANEVKIELI